MILTVAELIAKLQAMPQDARVLASGVDCGGYDACWKDDCDVTLENGIVYVDGEGTDVTDTGEPIW